MSYSRIGIFGWNGYKNVGDDAMLQVIVSIMSDKFGAKEMKVWGDRDSLPILTTPVSALSNFRTLSRVKGFYRFIAPCYYMPAFTKNLDVLIIGGGSLFHTTGVSKFMNTLIDTTKRGNPQAIVCAIGVSIGPFYTPEAAKMSTIVLNKMNFISVRDETSIKALESLGVNSNFQYAPDLAMLLKSSTVRSQSINSCLIVGVSLRFGAVDQVWLELIKQILFRLKSSFSKLEIRIFNFCDHSNKRDQVETEKLIREVGQDDGFNFVVVPYTSDTRSFYTQIEQCDLMLCMRLHAAIIAYTVGTKLLILPYHRKCIDFAKLVFDDHYENFIVEKKAHVDDWSRKLECLLEVSPVKLFKARDSFISSAEKHFQPFERMN